MTLGQMKAYIASLVDDLNYGYFTETQLLRFINQAQRETQKKLIQAGNNWYLKENTSLTTVANQSDYSLPSDFLKLNRLEVVRNISTPNETINALSSITLNQKDFFPTSGDPIAFYFKKNTLVLTPKPQSSGDTLRLTYTYRVLDLVNDNDVPDVPEEFHDYMAHLATIQCFIKDGRDASLLVSYTKEVEKRLDADAIERAQDRASTIVQTIDDVMGFPF